MTKEQEPPNKVGRPLKYETTEELQAVMDSYFKQCDDDKELYTITGLALALDLSRQSVLRYEGRPEFRDTIKRGKLRVENSYEKSLRNDGGAAEIFGLKNFGWSDRHAVELTGAEGGAIKTSDTITHIVLDSLTLDQLEKIKQAALDAPEEKQDG